MTWQDTGTSCVALTSLASKSGTFGTILSANSVPDELPERPIAVALTRIFST